MVSYKETLFKTLIWRVIATSITILVSWFITGSLKFGLAVGSIDTILKPIETETIVKQEKYYHKYVSFNYNYIQSSVKVGDRYYI